MLLAAHVDAHSAAAPAAVLIQVLAMRHPLPSSASAAVAAASQVVTPTSQAGPSRSVPALPQAETVPVHRVSHSPHCVAAR